jgi:hypothetical protein
MASVKKLTPHFSDDDLCLISELLRVAQQSLLDTQTVLTRVYPSSPTIERLAIWSEQAADIRERIEGR